MHRNSQNVQRKQTQPFGSPARRAIGATLATLSFAVLSLDAGAQSLVHDVPPPWDGAYFDFAQPGTGLWLDSGPDGKAFGATFYYTEDGRPTFATFASNQSTFGSLGEAFSAARALRGPLYVTVDGQCPGCPYRAPTATPLADPFIALMAHRDARVTLGTTRFDMGAMPIGQRDVDLLEGTWWLALDDLARFSPGIGPVSVQEDRELTAVVRFVKNPAWRRVSAIASEGEEVAYSVECVASCGDFEAWRTALGPDVRVAAFALDDRNPLNADAHFARYVETQDGLELPNGSYPHALRVDPYRAYSVLTAARAPRVALYRTPIVAPCDGNTMCNVADGVYGSRALPVDPTDRLRDRLGGGSVEITGAWYDPRQSGTGLWIDAGRNGETFMTLMTYAARADGGADPVFYTLGGPIGLGEGPIAIATVRSPLYESRDGQRIGGTWRAPVTRVATELGEAQVRIFGPESVELRVAGTTYDMIPMRADRQRTALPRGRWLLTMRSQEQLVGEPATLPTLPNTVTATVEIEEAVIAGGDSDTLRRPGAGATTYRVRCVASCADFDVAFPENRGAGLWVDPEGVAVLSTVTTTPGQSTQVAQFATQFVLQLGDETIDGTGFPLQRGARRFGEFGQTFANLSRLRMYRSPPDAFCDTDDTCR